MTETIHHPTEPESSVPHFESYQDALTEGDIEVCEEIMGAIEALEEIAQYIDDLHVDTNAEGIELTARRHVNSLIDQGIPRELLEAYCRYGINMAYFAGDSVEPLDATSQWQVNAASLVAEASANPGDRNDALDFMSLLNGRGIPALAVDRKAALARREIMTMNVRRTELQERRAELAGNIEPEALGLPEAIIKLHKKTKDGLHDGTNDTIEELGGDRERATSYVEAVNTANILYLSPELVGAAYASATLKLQNELAQNEQLTREIAGIIDYDQGGKADEVWRAELAELALADVSATSFSVDKGLKQLNGGDEVEAIDSIDATLHDELDFARMAFIYDQGPNNPFVARAAKLFADAGMDFDIQLAGGTTITAFKGGEVVEQLSVSQLIGDARRASYDDPDADPAENLMRKLAMEAWLVDVSQYVRELTGQGGYGFARYNLEGANITEDRPVHDFVDAEEHKAERWRKFFARAERGEKIRAAEKDLEALHKEWPAVPVSDFRRRAEGVKKEKDQPLGIMRAFSSGSIPVPGGSMSREEFQELLGTMLALHDELGEDGLNDPSEVFGRFEQAAYDEQTANRTLENSLAVGRLNLAWSWILDDRNALSRSDHRPLKQLGEAAKKYMRPPDGELPPELEIRLIEAHRDPKVNEIVDVGYGSEAPGESTAERLVGDIASMVRQTNAYEAERGIKVEDRQIDIERAIKLAEYYDQVMEAGEVDDVNIFRLSNGDSPVPRHTYAVEMVRGETRVVIVEDFDDGETYLLSEPHDDDERQWLAKEQLGSANIAAHMGGRRFLYDSSEGYDHHFDRIDSEVRTRLGMNS